MSEQRFSGDTVGIARNTDDLYEGDLVHYVSIVFRAPNIHHGYHGLRHMLYVTWVCYQACKYYGKRGEINSRDMRNLLIAALFHDYDHVGTAGDDAENIKKAIKGMRHNLLYEDENYADGIAEIIQATQFPHADLGTSPRLEARIIRDADVSQAFGTTWVGDIAAGFGSELGRTPIEMLENQLKFLDDVVFYSEFGKTFFGEEAIVAKRQETHDLLAIIRS